MVHSLGVMGGSDCELLRAGWLAQPANAVSAAAFLGVAVWICVRRPHRSHWAALLIGAGALAAVGAGSIVYHGPQPAWARPLHDGSIVALIVVDAVLFGAARVQKRSTAAARAAWKRAAAWMAAAFAALVAGRTGGWLCDPASPLQPHALWHLFSAVGLGWLARGSAQAAAATPVLEP